MKSSQSTRKNNEVPHIDDVQFIEKNNGFIKGYSVNTYHGMAKNYNQDRVSIIMNITKPKYKGVWPKCSYFGIFDGHGGNACSDFLKDQMHKYITQNQYFPSQPIQALKEGFRKAEIQFLRLAESKSPVQRSGSCALVLLVIDQVCYIANVGDCRIILSTNSGKTVYPVSKDHKPDSQTQKMRIQEAGGSIYQSCIKTKNGNTIYGPHRINPGKLSVSRSFGDIQAKLPKYGGNSKVLIAKPQITYFTINPNEHDFLMMGSDGIFDKMSNQEIVEEFWTLQSQSLTKKFNNQQNLKFIGKAASRIITKAMQKVSLDNLTTLLIIFEDNGKLSQQRPTRKLIMEPSKQKRVKSTSNYGSRVNSTYQNQRQKVSQFAIRRQVSKARLNQMVRKPINDVQHEQKSLKDFSDESDRNMNKKISIYHSRQQNQNCQNRQNRAEMANRLNKERQQASKSVQKTIQNKISNFNDLQGLKRKKSQGILRKQSKKQSVWSSISKGLKKDDKTEKIRY